MDAAQWPWAVQVEAGCGVLVSPTCVVTAAHVVTGKPTAAITFLASGERLTGTVEFATDGTDLALIRLAEPSVCPVAPVRPFQPERGRRVAVPGNLTSDRRAPPHR